MADAAMRICREKSSWPVVASSFIFSIIASCVVWEIIWLVSIGELGSWLRSWVTSSDINTSESMVCFGVLAVGVAYIPVTGTVAASIVIADPFSFLVVAARIHAITSMVDDDPC